MRCSGLISGSLSIGCKSLLLASMDSSRDNDNLSSSIKALASPVIMQR